MPEVESIHVIPVMETNTTERLSPWSDRRFLAVFGASLGLNALLALLLPRDAYLDEWAYRKIALDWIANGVYPTTFRPPLYPALLALSFRVGLGTGGLRIAQSLMTALTLIPVYRIARRNYGLNAARVAICLVAFNPVLLMFASRLWTETIFILLLMLILDLLTLGKATPRRWALAGFLYGLAALTRPVVLTVLPLLAIWAWLQARRDGRNWRPWAVSYAALAVVALMVILPWTVRNARATGAFILIDSNGPYNLLVATEPDAQFVEKDDVWHERFGAVGGDFYEHMVKVDPARAQSLAMAAARRNIAADPGRFARKSVWEAAHLWTADSYLLRHLRNRWFGDVPQWAVITLTIVWVCFFAALVVSGLAGLAATPPGPFRGLALLLTVHATVFFGLIYSLSRYLIPLHPVLAIPAAVALTSLAATARAVIRAASRRRRATFWLVLVALIVVWIGDFPKIADMVTSGGSHYLHTAREKEISAVR